MSFIATGSAHAIEIFITQLWPAGPKPVGPIAIPPAFGYGMMMLDISHVTDLSTEISVILQLSFDAGMTWSDLGGWGLDLRRSGFRLVGGTVMDAAGQPVRISGSTLRLTERSTHSRQLRGLVTLTEPTIVGLTLAIW